VDRPPLVSVVIPTYNREALLREAVGSVLTQTYREWELIVVDDGSTDGTAAYLGAVGHPRVTVIRRPHSANPALLRNTGVRASRGDYVAFLDSDDVWFPDKLDRQVRDALEHPECGWSYTGLVHIDGRGRETAGHRAWVPYRGWILEPLLDGRATAQTSTVMIERALFDSVGGFDESLLRCQDYDLWLRLAERSETTVLETPLVGFRQHAGNTRVGWLDVLGYMDRIYSRLLARSSSPSVRRLGRQQWVRVSLDIADKSRAAGRYGDAIRALAACSGRGWSRPRWWLSLAKTALRPLLPRGLLARYYRATEAGREQREAPGTP
jgi:glycosyltransferase involved in cell wall biosynthesis